MGAYYDEIEIEDMTWDESKGVFHYPCPCGDRFEISKRQLANCEDIATCPSCSLIIRVIYDPVSTAPLSLAVSILNVLQLDYEDYESDDDEDGEHAEGDEDEDEDGEGSEEDTSEDAMENLTISTPALVSAAA